MQEDKTAVIIGAGPAGLTAAYELLKTTGIHPVILEADSCIGGLARTVKYNGNRMDIGGHRFFTKDEEVQKLWNEILPTMQDPVGSKSTFLVRNRVSRILYRGHFFSYPVSLSLDTFRGLGLADSALIGASYLESCFRKRPEKSLEDFMVNRFGERLYQTFFEKYTEKVWGRLPKDIGTDWGSQRIKGVSLWKVMEDCFSRALSFENKEKETSLIESFLYPKLGPGQFYETLAKKVDDMGGEIRYGCRATALLGKDGRISGVYYVRADGTEEGIDADFVLSSMPIRTLATALPVGILPDKLWDVARTLPYRDFMTAGLLVNGLETGKIPDDWIYIQEPEVKLGRLQVFNNWSPYLVKNPDSTVWLGLEYFCSEGDWLWVMSDESFLNFAADELERIGIIKKESVIDGCVVRMKKAYPAYFDSYKDFPELRQALQGIDGLYCIGRNGQHRYNNMDHSMKTAIEAVRVIRGEATQEDLWNVNEEKSYHEESGQ